MTLMTCEACPYALVCLMGGPYPHFLMARVCPRCGIVRFIKDRGHSNHNALLTGGGSDEDIAEKPYIHCPKRQLTCQQKGTWKAQCKRHLKNDCRVADIRDTFITVTDPEQRNAPYGMLVIMCDTCFEESLEGAAVPMGMGTALPHTFFGWCPD